MTNGKTLCIQSYTGKGTWCGERIPKIKSSRVHPRSFDKRIFFYSGEPTGRYNYIYPCVCESLHFVVQTDQGFECAKRGE